MFSLFLPTRGRKKLLTELLTSLKETVVGEVEVLIALDTDDKSPELHIYPNTRYFRVKRSDNFSRDYYNYLASKSRGKYLVGINDDCEFLTYGWDVKSEEEIEEFLKDKPDRLLYGIFDTLDGSEIAWFPVMTRETYETLGYYCNELFPTNGADRNLKKVFTIPRQLKLSSQVLHKQHKDELSMRICDISNKFSMLDHSDYDKIHKHYEKLINRIKEKEICLDGQRKK